MPRKTGTSEKPSGGRKNASAIKTEEQGWRSLFAAILNKAISDTASDTYGNDARWFADTGLCMELCDELGISHDAYRKKVFGRKR